MLQVFNLNPALNKKAFLYLSTDCDCTRSNSLILKTKRAKRGGPHLQKMQKQGKSR